MLIILTSVLAVAFLVILCLYLNKSKSARNMFSQLNEDISTLRNNLKLEKDKNLQIFNALIVDHEAELRKITEDYRSEIKKLQEYNNSLQNGLDMYKEQQRRALILHPDLENEIDRMIKEEIIRADIEKAKEFDELANNVAYKTASRYIADELKDVLTKYNELTDNQKGYIASNIEQIYSLYEASSRLQNMYLQN